MTAKTENDEPLVPQPGGPQNIFIKNQQLSCNFQVSCKAISQANLFSSKFSKMKLGGARGLNDQEKRSSNGRKWWHVWQI